MTRRYFIERALRQIYGGQPTDDSQITVNLVNSWLNDAIAVAAKKNYTDALSISGVGYVNNTFYTTFTGLTPSPDGRFTWKVTLPELPVGIGKNEGISNVVFKDSTGEFSQQLIPLSINQSTYYDSMKPIPNKTVYINRGNAIYVKTALTLNNYTVTVTMISGGDSSDLDSILNVPSDYFPIMVEYIKSQLGFERAQPQDSANDGADLK